MTNEGNIDGIVENMKDKTLAISSVNPSELMEFLEEEMIYGTARDRNG